MADHGHEYADDAVKSFQAEVKKLYEEAERDAMRALDEYLSRLSKADAEKLALVEAGELGKREYASWRNSKMLTGKRYRAVVGQMADGMSKANENALKVLAGKLPDVAAENANFAAFQIEKSIGMSTAFSLQDANTVKVLLSESGAYLPKPRLDIAKDMRWNRKQMQSAVSKGVLLGEPIPKISKRLQSVTGSNMATATRTARTAVTAAENAGRVSSYASAEQMGISLKKEWLAALDGRTRHSHRLLDGERVENDKPFSNGCMYPGDPEAPYSETANCRCTLVAAVDGVDTSDAKRWSKLPSDMSYEEWKGIKSEASRLELSAYRGKITEAEGFEWKNDAVSRLASKEEVAEYLGEQHNVTVLDSFSELSLEQQKDVAAGMDRAVMLYGEHGARHIGALRNRGDEGLYSYDTDTIMINPKTKEAYITAFHETVHSIDARKSYELEIKKSDGAVDDFCVHSARVIAEAKREWAKERRSRGLKAGKNAYESELINVFGYNVREMNRYINKPNELVAYSLEAVELGSQNELALAISRRF